ncbi:MAG: hypothetical protein LUE08_00080 [Akkermansiaceae bacterium]|nr:hypothetical protein [Akkermansiaceae bacterium]
MKALAFAVETAEFAAYVLACTGKAAWWVLRAAIVLACMLAPAIYGYLLDNL